MRYGIGYLRVSSGEQLDSGLGEAAQRKAITDYAAANDIVVMVWEMDGAISGGKPIEDRPGLAAVIDAVKRGYVVLIAKRDRFARDSMVASAAEYMIERRGGVVVSVEDGEEADPMTRQIMKFVKDLVATMERLNGKARMRAAWAAKRARGETMGMAPSFGTKLAEDGRTVIRDERAEEIIREMVRRYEAGQSTIRIAAWLNDAGVKTAAAAHSRKGSGNAKWSPSVVNNVLRRAGVKFRKGPKLPKWIGQYNLKLEGERRAAAV